MKRHLVWNSELQNQTSMSYAFCSAVYTNDQNFGLWIALRTLATLGVLVNVTPQLGYRLRLSALLYDAVSDLMHNWVPQRPDFKSALREVKMVLNTQCFPYLWLMMWFHAKKIQRKKCWLSYVDSVPRLRNYQKYTKKPCTHCYHHFCLYWNHNMY